MRSNVIPLKPEFDGSQPRPTLAYMEMFLPAERLSTSYDYIVAAAENLQGYACGLFIDEYRREYHGETREDCEEAEARILGVISSELPEMYGMWEDAIMNARASRESRDLADWLDTNRSAS